MRNRLFFRRVLRAHHLFAGHRPPRCHPSRPSLKGYQRGRIPDQGIDIPFLSRAWPALPPRPCSSERAVPAMAGGERSWAATGHAGRRSVRGCVRTLERGNEQRRASRGHRVHRRPERTRAVVGAKNFSPLRTPSRIVANGAHYAPFTKTRNRLFVRRVRRAHHVRGALSRRWGSGCVPTPGWRIPAMRVHGPGVG